MSEQHEVQPVGLDVLLLERLILDAISGPARLACGQWRAVDMRAAVVACLECWSYAFERGEEWGEAAPAAVRLHARRAACAGVELQALLRCYTRSRDLAWRAMCRQFAQTAPQDGWVLAQQAWAAGESLLACVQDAIEAAYHDELECVRRTPEQQQASLVHRLLRGDQSVDARMIDHDFNGSHLGLVLVGEDADRAFSTLVEFAGCRSYSLPEQNGTMNGWLSGGREVRPKDLDRWLPVASYRDLTVAVGRSAAGLDGFCETHQLATEALRVARRRALRVAWHADVELDVLLLRDPAFARSLITNYITRLDPELLQTLHVYSRNGWNESAAARQLGLHRGTINKRIERIELAVGRPIDVCRFPLELALRALALESLDVTPTNDLSTQQPVENLLQKVPQIQQVAGSNGSNCVVESAKRVDAQAE